MIVTKVFADREKKRKMLEERANDEKSVDDSTYWLIYRILPQESNYRNPKINTQSIRRRRRNAEAALEAAEKRKLAEEFAKNYEVRYLLIGGSTVCLLINVGYSKWR